MPLFSFEGRSPTVHPTAFVAPTAVLVGDVVVEAGASIWYGAVLRGDWAPIHVRAGANVQDGSVLHSSQGQACEIGPGATVGHLCVVHGAVIGEGALVANGATVLDGAVVGAHALVAAHSFVAAGAQIPAGTLAAGSPAEVKREIAGTAAGDMVAAVPKAYVELGRRHAEGVEEIT
jgi:carbonic anhydrase/acetyltransferase-like protein (isoleucine patch superfamily)